MFRNRELSFGATFVVILSNLHIYEFKEIRKTLIVVPLLSEQTSLQKNNNKF